MKTSRNKSRTRGLALFDFDGTIYKKDSLIEFTKYTKGSTRTFVGLVFLSPVLILNRLGIYPSDKAKLIYLNHFFSNDSKEDFVAKAKEFSLQEIDKSLNKEMLKKIVLHKQLGDRIIVVSASLKCWLQPWCKKRGLELASTEISFENNGLKYKRKNCTESEKVVRILEKISNKKYASAIAYGDSSGDDKMIEFAQKYSLQTADKQY